MKTTTLVSLLALGLCLSSTAMAQTTVYRHSGGYGGSNEISTQMGFQASMGGGTPNGFKLFFDYSHRLTDLVWLNFKLNPTFDVGDAHTTCVDSNGNIYDCSTGFGDNGWALDLLGGVKLKWMTRVHVLPYVNIDAGVVPIFGRPAGDNGAAVVLHSGGGAKYFITPRIGLGGELDFTLGPGFYSASNTVRSHTEFYRAFNFAVGAEFLL